jgi:iron-sulfur cluster assembly accessory protein
MAYFRLVVGAILLLICELSVGCNQSPLPDGVPPSPDSKTFKSAKPSEPTFEEAPLVKVTPKAAGVIQQIFSEQGLTGSCYLRVRVVAGGCSGFMHKLDLDPQTSVEDYIFESGGVKVVIFKRQIEMVRGSQVDFGMEGDKQGFKIQNPNFEGEAAKKWLPELAKEKDIR